MTLSGNFVGADVDLKRIRKDRYVFTNGRQYLNFTATRYVRRIVDDARALMTQSIGEHVYAVPEGEYKRTQTLWQGVRTRDFGKGMAAGEIFIDKDIEGPNGYWYPVSVEFGLRTHPAYWGRRYWELGFPNLIMMFDEEVTRMFGEVKDHLRR